MTKNELDAEIKAIKRLALFSAMSVGLAAGFVGQRIYSHRTKGTRPKDIETGVIIVAIATGTLCLSQAVVATGFLAYTKQM